MTFEEAIDGLDELTLFDVNKLRRLWDAIKETDRVSGAVAELGVYKGGTALLLHRARPQTPLLLFDTFEGLPEDDTSGPHRKGEFAAPLEGVRSLFAGRRSSLVRFFPGRFPDTVEKVEAAIRYSFVHVDADLERSTADAIDYFWPRLSPGGVMAFDDYGWDHCPGVRRVVDAFASVNGLLVDDHPNHLAIVRKPMELPLDTSSRVSPIEDGKIAIGFRHGFGDCVHFAAMLHLWKSRGWNVAVRCEPNKVAIFDAAGIDRVEESSDTHPWVYHAGFNSPTEQDGEGNKVWANLDARPMPRIGGRSELWEELRRVRLEDGAKRSSTEEFEKFADDFLRHLPEPWVVFAPQGSNWKHRKDMTEQETRETIERLLEETPASIILADWDNRVRFPNSGRIRHVKRDAGHLDLRKFLPVMDRCSLTVSVDTGPLHYSALTQCHALGVFFDLHPIGVTIPRPNAAMLTPPHRHNPTHRIGWNLIESMGMRPTPEEIVRHAKRMLKSKGAFGTPAREAMMESLIDRCRGSTDLTPVADRRSTFRRAIREARERFTRPRTTETGVTGDENWSGNGGSSVLFALLADATGGKHDGVDVDGSKVSHARKACRGLSGSSFVVSDSVEFLRGRNDPIDVLYLDSADRDGREEESRCLAEYVAAERLLTERSLVAVDDTVWDGRWRGLGASLVPRLLESGWNVIASGYQVVLSRTR